MIDIDGETVDLILGQPVPLVLNFEPVKGVRSFFTEGLQRAARYPGVAEPIKSKSTRAQLWGDRPLRVGGRV